MSYLFDADHSRLLDHHSNITVAQLGWERVLHSFISKSAVERLCEIPPDQGFDLVTPTITRNDYQVVKHFRKSYTIIMGGGQELEKCAQELVDVLGCYFPIVYTPPADTTGKVTREELVSGVENALSAAPAFARHVVPMLLEKLSSSFRCRSVLWWSQA